MPGAVAVRTLLIVIGLLGAVALGAYGALVLATWALLVLVGTVMGA